MGGERDGERLLAEVLRIALDRARRERLLAHRGGELAVGERERANVPLQDFDVCARVVVACTREGLLGEVDADELCGAAAFEDAQSIARAAPRVENLAACRELGRPRVACAVLGGDQPSGLVAAET